MDYYVPLELSYLSRQTNYADDFCPICIFTQTMGRRRNSIRKKKVNSETYNDLLNKYLA